MHFQFLIEDLSGEALVKLLMEKVQKDYPDITTNYKGFHGLGGFSKKKGSAKDMKTVCE